MLFRMIGDVEVELSVLHQQELRMMDRMDSLSAILPHIRIQTLRPVVFAIPELLFILPFD